MLTSLSFIMEYVISSRSRRCVLSMSLEASTLLVLEQVELGGGMGGTHKSKPPYSATGLEGFGCDLCFQHRPIGCERRKGNCGGLNAQDETNRLSVKHKWKGDHT